MGGERWNWPGSWKEAEVQKQAAGIPLPMWSTKPWYPTTTKRRYHSHSTTLAFIFGILKVRALTPIWFLRSSPGCKIHEDLGPCQLLHVHSQWFCWISAAVLCTSLSHRSKFKLEMSCTPKRATSWDSPPLTEGIHNINVPEFFTLGFLSS